MHAGSEQVTATGGAAGTGAGAGAGAAKASCGEVLEVQETSHNKGIANVTVLACHEPKHNLAFPNCCYCVCCCCCVLHVILGRCASIREGLPEIALVN